MDFNGSYTRHTPRRRRRDIKRNASPRARKGHLRLLVSLSPENAMRDRPRIQ